MRNKRRNRLTLDEALFITKQIILGVKTLLKEKPPVAHRDLKPQNIGVRINQSFGTSDKN